MEQVWGSVGHGDGHSLVSLVEVTEIGCQVPTVPCHSVSERPAPPGGHVCQFACCLAPSTAAEVRSGPGTAHHT